ncbi:diguanylate cyclase [Pseudomonas sp. NPDC096917]|uniref:sensor domain-containing diguanylate cyclase n=1 Tax=Pseudomonas sp. NPDC096917 TaxID=3364483 RepID=UPI00383A8A95
MVQILSALSDSLPTAQSLEELTRPLLALLSEVTGMESTYLTTIDADEGIQRVEFARNVGDMVIPEGLAVPWADTLCKRAMDENRMYSDNVSEVWGDSKAAAALGIMTYVSTPIRSQSGQVLGTICAASSKQVARSPEVEPLLILLAALLGYALERGLLVEQLQVANADLTKQALTDPLTGLANRRAVLNDAARLFELAQRENKYILISVIDLDGFKHINDTRGHVAGDRLLCGVAAQLQHGLRSSDIIGRIGGDEFIVIALGTPIGHLDQETDMQHAAELLQDRLAKATIGRYELGQGLGGIEYTGASVGVVTVIPGNITVEEATKLADREMYKVKQERKAQRL